MSDDPKRRPVHPLVAVGFAVLLAGLLGWIWTGEWRWAVTGIACLVAAVGAAAREGKAHR